MKKIRFGDLTEEERIEIASIAFSFARHQASIDSINDRLKALVDEKKQLTEQIDQNRQRYSALEASMVDRIGEKFELLIEDESLLKEIQNQAVK